MPQLEVCREHIEGKFHYKQRHQIAYIRQKEIGAKERSLCMHNQGKMGDRTAQLVKITGNKQEKKSVHE